VNTIKFSDRISNIQPSFIREILKVSDKPDIISFAGGLPNKDFFPSQTLAKITTTLMQTEAQDILQYGQSEGEYALRCQISKRYQDNHQMHVPVDNILITNGSQQGFDLIGKTLINEGDGIVIEAPAYLGAIQALMMFQPQFLPVPIEPNGLDIESLTLAMAKNPKLIYSVPNFQNPTGFSYSSENRTAITNLVSQHSCLIVEDDPYGDIRFDGGRAQSFYEYLPEQTILLGSFSKIISPGLRVGWMVAPPSIMEKLLIAKQASDLHTSRLSQRIIADYIGGGYLASHIDLLCDAYGQRCQIMGETLDSLFGDQLERSHPQGGMFMWLKFLESSKSSRRIDTQSLFKKAYQNGVAFVPGQPFYFSKTGDLNSSSLRLNYSNASFEQIQSGLERLYDSFCGLSDKSLTI
jgi:2-aminoadipate transaminase